MSTCFTIHIFMDAPVLISLYTALFLLVKMPYYYPRCTTRSSTIRFIFPAVLCVCMSVSFFNALYEHLRRFRSIFCWPFLKRQRCLLRLQPYNSACIVGLISAWVPTAAIMFWTKSRLFHCCMRLVTNAPTNQAHFL